MPTADPPRGAGGWRRTAVSMVVTGSASVQFGASVAALLFALVGPLGAVLLRTVFAAVVLLVVCRPRLRGYSPRDWLLVVGFGLCLAAMNSLIYQAIERIPLGVAVTLEMLGPLALSVITGRRLLSLLWAVTAMGGVVVLGGGTFSGVDLVGVGCALGAATAWASYILLSARTGARFPRTDGLAIAMAVAALVMLPLGASAAGATLLDPTALWMGAVVALLSSVLPYSLELWALRILPAATFAVLMSLDPVMASLAGFLVLDQTLAALDLLGIALVMVATVGAVRTPPGRSWRGG